MTINMTTAVLTTAKALADKPRLPAPADAATSMSVLSQAIDIFCDFGRSLCRECPYLIEHAPTTAISASYEQLRSAFAPLPKHAARLAVKFAELGDLFDALRAITSPRQATPSQQCITTDDAAAFQTAVRRIGSITRLPRPEEGAQLMRILADAMFEFINFGTKLDRKCRIGAQNAITAAIATLYNSLADQFTAVRHHANEMRAVFINAADAYEHLNGNVKRWQQHQHQS